MARNKRRRAKRVEREEPVAATSLQPTVEEILPGTFRIRVHRLWNPERAVLLGLTPQDVAHEIAMERVTKHLTEEEFTPAVTERRRKELASLPRAIRHGE